MRSYENRHFVRFFLLRSAQAVTAKNDGYENQDGCNNGYGEPRRVRIGRYQFSDRGACAAPNSGAAPTSSGTAAASLSPGDALGRQAMAASVHARLRPLSEVGVEPGDGVLAESSALGELAGITCPMRRNFILIFPVTCRFGLGARLALEPIIDPVREKSVGGWWPVCTHTSRSFSGSGRIPRYSDHFQSRSECH
jgi:hypothetical protein